jgi:hypothetical protein
MKEGRKCRNDLERGREYVNIEDKQRKKEIEHGRKISKETRQ